MLVLPGFVSLAFVASMGPALWITALNVRYRDFRYVIPFIVPGFAASVLVAGFFCGSGPIASGAPKKRCRSDLNALDPQ